MLFEIARQSNEEQHGADAIAAALYKDPIKKSFWNILSKSAPQNCIPACVGGIWSPQAMCDLWKNHYSNLLNCIPETNQDDK